MALSIPSTLKATQLKALAFKCGISISGTKAVLTRRLQDDISSTPKQSPKPTRILSIDMGIRNLAYCILDVPAARSKSRPPTIIAWHRLAVSSAPSITTPSLQKAEKECFSPATLSAAAYTLLRQSLLPHAPTTILIERQRFRSMGSPHILEWTIRVNMFESMLYAILHTLRSEGLWTGDVREIAPGKVGPFWIADEEGEGMVKKRKGKDAKSRNKGLKIDLVRTWLRDGDMVGLGNEEVADMAKKYMEKWDRKTGRQAKGKVVADVDTQLVDVKEEMGKLDDLADCLLQGMAWVRWQENRRYVLKKGVEKLLEE